MTVKVDDNGRRCFYLYGEDAVKMYHRQCGSGEIDYQYLADIGSVGTFVIKDRMTLQEVHALVSVVIHQHDGSLSATEISLDEYEEIVKRQQY